jgi:hypothetical protein
VARNQIKLAMGEKFDLSQSARYTVIKIIQNG